MAFGNITTLYIPTASNAGASQWGTDVRKLLNSADAGSDSTTKTDHGTSGAPTRTVDPYTTSSTNPALANLGWAITPSDMNSVTGALRFFPAGNHVATVRMGHNAATAVTGTLSMVIWRVGPSPARTRVLLDFASVSVDLPDLAGEVTAVVTVALPEVVFEADETVQYSFSFACASVPVTGRIATFFTGTQSSVAARIATPKLGVLADTTGTATGVGTASGTTGKVLNTTGTATSSGTAAGVGASRADTTGTAAGSVVVTGLGSSVAGTTGTAAGSATTDGQASRVLGTTGTVEIGTGGGGTTIVRKFWHNEG